jgi:hypothetical protein
MRPFVTSIRSAFRRTPKKATFFSHALCLPPIVEFVNLSIEILPDLRTESLDGSRQIQKTKTRRTRGR